MYISEPGRDPWKIHRFRLRWEKNLQEWGGEGDKGGKGKKNWGKITEGKKWKGKKRGGGERKPKQGELNCRRAYLEPFAQEPNALPYCDCPASL